MFSSFCLTSLRETSSVLALMILMYHLLSFSNLFGNETLSQIKAYHSERLNVKKMKANLSKINSLKS